MISVTGEEGGDGVRAGVSIADLTAGMNAIIGILLAIRVREKTGEGQSIDVSMLEGQLSLLGIMISSYLADMEMPTPMGTAYKALLPYQVFNTKSRPLALAIGSERLWKTFCPLIGRPDLIDDAKYRINADRARNRDSLIEAIQQLFLTQTYEHWEALFLEHGIPVGAINDIAQVVDHPQVKARKALADDDGDSCEARALERLQAAAWPCRPRQARGPAPRQAQTVLRTVCVRARRTESRSVRAPLRKC